MDEKLKKIIIYVVAGFVILFIILFAISSCQSKKVSYEKYQEKMEKAAKSYFESHEDELPTEDKKTSEYTLKEMIDNGAIDDYIKAFDDESIKCDGGVTVTNNNGYYLYTSELDCGDKYLSNTLAQKIKEDNLTETGNGLYEVGDKYVFRGDLVNNHATFAGESWRILGIDENNNINLIQEKSKKSCIYDSHFNTETNEVGINQYYQGDGKYSDMMKCLDEYYKNEIKDDETKAYLSTQTVCYGARSLDDITTDGSTECTSYIEKQPLNLIGANEYIRASIDSNCISIDSYSCENYNWITSLRATYLMTPSTSKSYFAYYKNDSGVSETRVNNYLPVLVKIAIKGDVNYTTGDGTEEKPYEIGDVTKKK